MPPNTQPDREGSPETTAGGALAAVAESYAKRRAELAAIEADLEARSARVSALRGVTFLATAAAAGYAVFRGASTPVIVGASAAGAVFLGLVIQHAALVTREAAVKQRIRLVDASIERIKSRPRRSAAVADGPAKAASSRRASQKSAEQKRRAPPDHPYANDLDIFGEREICLFEHLDRTQTEPGESTLASWLSSPSSPEAIAERQVAVRELASLDRFREDLAVLGMSAETRGRPVDPLLAWAEAPPVLASRAGEPSTRAILVIAAALVLVTVTLFTLDQAFGAALLGPFRRAWLVTTVLQLVVLIALRGKIEPLLAAASSKQAPFGRYRALFERVEEESFKAPRTETLSATIRGETGRDASSAMRSLESIIGYADLRHTGLLYIFINIFLLWDIWCAVALDRWRARSGRRTRAWLSSLGEIEAIASLATFTFERPDHRFPEVKAGPPRFEAAALGHPMIPPDVRVSNDVSFPRPGSALLITGSNMSGKSTLLRAIGINAVLAQAGAPVCASSLRMSPLAVRTSMRIDDSLEQGISHFYAELERLKAIVDSADRGEGVLFLLDEILHGTNSRERHIGAKAVVLRLLDRGAIGAVSSHDLALADLCEASGDRVLPAHFEEIIRDDRMAFDYILKPGVVTTTNALRLMRLVGLDIPGL